jgi:hypothetical protein
MSTLPMATCVQPRGQDHALLAILIFWSLIGDLRHCARGASLTLSALGLPVITALSPYGVRTAVPDCDPGHRACNSRFGQRGDRYHLGRRHEN